MDCGPTCLRMLSRHYGRNYTIQTLRKYCQAGRRGVSLLGISEAAEKIGFRTLGARLSVAQLKEVELPCVLHWRRRHFVVLYKIKRGKFYIADPASGIVVLSEADFTKNWLEYRQLEEGVSLLLSPSPLFYEQEEESKPELRWGIVFRYFLVYKRLFFQLILGLALGSLLSLIAPFLTQAMVDFGINGHNISFVYIILIAQIMLFIGSTSVNFIRSWILLHISTRINISILTDFLIKLMNLPVSFMSTKTTGDIMQRIGDQQTIENFLTSTTLNTIFSVINLVIYTIVLINYNVEIFVISIISTILYSLWIVFFLKRRRELNYKQFDSASANKSTVVELINGMQDIKLSNSEKQKRWEWEHVQARLFKFKVESLALTQTQSAGAMFINQAKNILITFLSVKAVISGDLTIGGMMAVQYLVGQISNPVSELLGFIQSYQDARISLERLNEIHEMDDEESKNKIYSSLLPENKSITFRNITFRYPGAGNDAIIEDVNLYIPEGKTTAIVGMSGSGKTSLLKLLLRFYEPEKGDISVGGTRLDQISFSSWRNNCGTVMQDGYVFSDTVAGNIAVGDESPNYSKLQHAIKVANIGDFISELPLGINTRIGSGGSGISQGQKQRLFIARAVYKDPHYLFFDEATNALDANNERIIMNNLLEFFKGRTVVIIAHRLSTVSKADNIVVLDKGRIIEQGTHKDLSLTKGEYYNLVKNQLEFG